MLTGGLAIIVLLFGGLIWSAISGGGGGGGGGQQAQSADPFANGKFYTFVRRENKFGKNGEQLNVMVLAGSESETQLDKIRWNLDYNMSKYEIVMVGVLTEDEVTERQLEKITGEDKMFNKVPSEQFDQAGVLVIPHSELAEAAYSIPDGEHRYFASFEELKLADSEPVAEGEEQQQAPKEEPEQQEAGFGDGTYQVGTDIQPGTYRTRDGSPNCYYERLRNFTGNMNSILANNNTSAPAIVTIKPTDAGFYSQGCGTWTQDLSAITESKTSFGEGAYIVGTDMNPGTYRNSGGNNCYYERLRDFTGGMNSIIANGNPSAPTIVTITPTDAGFQSFDCGTWTMLE